MMVLAELPHIQSLDTFEVTETVLKRMITESFFL